MVSDKKKDIIYSRAVHELKSTLVEVLCFTYVVHEAMNTDTRSDYFVPCTE